MPGVDVLQGFQLSKKEFENVFLQAAERVEHSKASTPALQSAHVPTLSQPTPFRRRHLHAQTNTATLSVSTPSTYTRTSTPAHLHATRPPAGDSPLPAAGSTFRGGAQIAHPDALLASNPGTPAEAERHADACRRMAAALQKQEPVPDYDGAGELFEAAVDTRTRFGLFCTSSSADAHVEYAQNLSKRGLTPEAEYHLRTAADVYRILNARGARKYGDVLLYIAVVVDRQGRLAEAENFYRSALAVYRANKLSDDNVRVAIDSLSNNLRAQGRPEEVDTVIQRHFLGAPTNA
jgi:tetratricopeptide (TPR) repeat protein